MASSINSRMAAIGKTYPKTCRPTQRSIGTCIQWRAAGAIEQLMRTLHEQVREQVQKKPQWTTLIIIDSQAVKNTCNASVDSKGFCFYQATNGIKRHLAVDTLGFPFFTHCTPANVADDVGLIEMLRWAGSADRSFCPPNLPTATLTISSQNPSLCRRRPSS